MCKRFFEGFFWDKLFLDSHLCSCNHLFQLEQMRLKDERAKMCNEILNGVKVIKLYAWEQPMEEAVENIRKRELALVRKAGLVRSLADSFNTASPFLVIFLLCFSVTL